MKSSAMKQTHIDKLTKAILTDLTENEIDGINIAWHLFMNRPFVNSENYYGVNIIKGEDTYLNVWDFVFGSKTEQERTVKYLLAIRNIEKRHHYKVLPPVPKSIKHPKNLALVNYFVQFKSGPIDKQPYGTVEYPAQEITRNVWSVWFSLSYQLSLTDVRPQDFYGDVSSYCRTAAAWNCSELRYNKYSMGRTNVRKTTASRTRRAGRKPLRNVG